jgi:hypothetical protein
MTKWITVSIIIILVVATATLGLLLNQETHKYGNTTSDTVALEKSISTLQSSLESANSKIKTLSDENSLLKSNLAGVQANLATLIASNKELETKLNSTNSTLTSLSAQLQLANANLASIQNQQPFLTNQNLSLQDQLTDAFTQLTFYKNELSKASAHITWLENGLLQLQPGISLTYNSPPDNSVVGTVTLTTAPVGANLIIDGRNSGPSPLTVFLQVGPHLVSASLTGYNSANQTISIAPGNNGSMLITWLMNTN